MDRRFVTALLIGLAIAGCNASQGLLPPTVSTGTKNVAHGWNAPAPQKTYVPQAPIPPPPPSHKSAPAPYAPAPPQPPPHHAAPPYVPYPPVAQPPKSFAQSAPTGFNPVRPTFTPPLPPVAQRPAKHSSPPVSVPSRFGFASCTPPRKLLPFTWNSDAYRNKQVERFFTPLSHHETPRSFHRAISGKDLRVNQGPNDVCLTTDLDWSSFTDLDAVVTTFGVNKESYKCRYLEGKQKMALECAPKDKTGEAFRTYFTKSDDRTYLVAYHCWESGETEWFTFTNTKVLQPYLKREILQHVQSLGFDPEAYKEVDYKRCFPEGNQQLPAGNKKVLDNPFPKCTPPPSTFIKDLQYDSDLFQLQRKEEFYIPIAEDTGYTAIREFVTGRSYPSGTVHPVDFCPKYELEWKNQDSRFLQSADFSGRMERLSCKLLKREHSQTDLHVRDCFSSDGKPVFRDYITLTDGKTYKFAKQCWNTGRSTWVLYSAKAHIKPELKQKVLDHARELGFNPKKYQEINYDTCPGEDHFHDLPEQEVESETDIGDPTALFPKCSPPSTYLRRYTWESTSNREGVEFFDLAVAHPEVADVYRQSVGNFVIPQNKHTSNPECIRTRHNYYTNVTKHIGFGDDVSDDFLCTYASSQEWITECISKKSPWLSYRSYGIKSDNLSWGLTYQCLNTGSGLGWSVWTTPGTVLTPKSKSAILQAVKTLGFDPNLYVEYGAQKCVYKNRSFQQRTCDCCDEKNSRYI